jgi:hypothetical protein
MPNRRVCSVVVASVLIAGAGGTTGSGGTNVPTPAPSPPPTSCSTGLFQVRVTGGPSFVSCGAAGGQCTEIEYTVTGGIPDHVAAVEGVGVWYMAGPGNQWYQPCEGDPVTSLGKNSCHEQAAKFNPNAQVQKFKIGLAGVRKPSPTAVATKKGSRIGVCRILGIGLESGPNPFQQVQKTETVRFKNCSVDFHYDAATGEFLSAELAPDSAGCDFYETTIDQVTLTVPGAGELTDAKFGEGYISTGSDSCTTRIIGGKVYTWGSPCPQ